MKKYILILVFMLVGCATNQEYRNDRLVQYRDTCVNVMGINPNDSYRLNSCANYLYDNQYKEDVRYKGETYSEREQRERERMKALQASSRDSYNVYETKYVTKYDDVKYVSGDNKVRYVANDDVRYVVRDNNTKYVTYDESVTYETRSSTKKCKDVTINGIDVERCTYPDQDPMICQEKKVSSSRTVRTCEDEDSFIKRTR